MTEHPSPRRLALPATLFAAGVACASEDAAPPDLGQTPVERDAGSAMETDGGEAVDASRPEASLIRSCSDYLSAFENQADLLSASCVGERLRILSATGLPDPAPDDPQDRAMVGITSWIQRVPIPFELDWQLPATPTFLPEYEQTTGIGPVAVAINGVPIFHYEARPEQNIDPNAYDPRSDTVEQGELDQCGGHAGQGEDYHYHYAPVCLLEGHDLSEPIAFALDGLPIYFGTGGDDFYGRGRYSDLNNLPNGNRDSLDLCNAFEVEDGRYVYYTTAEPPYILGCHRASFDRATQINIPFQGRSQGSPVPFGTEAGEPFATDVQDWYQDDEGYHLTFTRNGGAIGEVIYQQVDVARDCWSFEFKSDTSDANGVVEEFCR